MKEYQVSYRGNRFVTRDNIIQVLEELGYNPGEGGGGFELDGVFNWYLRTGQGVGVQAPDLDLVGTEGYPWTANYQPPTANPDEKYVWKFTDFRYKDGSTPENPILHITVGPELITTFTSGGGMGVEFAYALFDKEITEVILSEDDGELPVSEAPNAVPQEGGEWTKSLDSLSYDADSYLWMSQRKISADGIPALWEKPIRLSGADGDPGADAFDTEFIYHRSGRKPTTEDDNLLHVDNIRSQDDYVPNNSNWMWTDNPQGVDNDIPEHKYEWMAFRVKMDPTHPDYDSSHPEWKWSHWSTIRIWSAYGERGMDGDGIEYVYRREWSGSPEDVNHSNEDFIPTTNNPTPSAPSGPVFIYGEDSSGQGGIEQSWNKGVYLIVNSDPTNPNNWRPEGWDGGFNRWKADVGTYNRQGEWVPKGWKDDPQGVDENHKKEYVSQRKRVNGVWGSFSTPTIWATFSKEHTITIEYINGKWVWVIDGDPTTVVAEGQNGKGIDLKGRVNFYDNESKNNYINNHSLTPEQIEELTSLEDVEERDNLDETNIGDCYVVDKGYGGRNAGHIFLYLGPDASTDWELRWYDFGEFQGDGSYMHIAWAHRIWTDDQGVLCSDGFRVDSELNNPTVEYEWMGICTNNEIADPDVNRLSEYKWNYVHGKDGDNYEWVYVRTKKEIAPVIKRESDGQGGYTYETYIDSEGNHSYQKDEYLPFISNPVDIYNSNNELKVEGCYPDNSEAGSVYQFYDDPKGVNNVYRYEWRSQRKRENGMWKDFGNVSLHATYSNDGQGVIRSTVFKRSVNKPIAPSGGEYGSPYPVDLTWHDGLPTDGQGSIWMSSRIFTSDGEDPEQSEWSNPILLQDSDTLDIELSPQPKNANPVIYPIDYSDPEGNRHNPGEPSGYDYSATGGKKQLWFDPEQDAAYISAHASEFNWMATRTNYIDPSSGEHRWRDWVVVLIKGETGEPGKTFQHAYVALPKTIDEAAFLLNPFVTNPTNINTAPTTSINSDTYTWQFTTAQISVTPSQYLWMTERWIQPDSDDAGNWDRPVRISGTGTPGEDAEDIEFIYKRENRLPNNSVGSTDLPSTSESSNGKNYSDNDFLPVGGWTDNPQGVGYFIEQDENNQDIEVFYKYEWMCQRIKPRGTGEQTWGSWSKIFVWSAYGDTGMDGDGVEYIFYREKEIEPKTPVGPYYKSSASSSAVKWTGGIVDISTTSTPDWRPKGIDTFYSWEYGSYNEQGEWIPTHWINNNSIVPVLSNEGDPIWTDEPLGVGEEYTIANPEFDSNQDEDPINNPRTLTKTYIHEWVSQRKRVNGSWGDFSEPTLWTNFSHTPEIYIDNGQWIVDGVPVGNAEGPAGQGIQLKGVVDVIYQKYATDGKTSLQWVNPWLPDENTSPYSDIEPGDCFVVRQTGHLYLCLHSKNNWNKTNQDVITDESWPYVSPMTNDPNWEDIGEFQGQGSYMHIAWAASDDKHFYGTSNIIFNQEDGKISLIKHFLTDYTLKLSDVDYDWMGVCTNNEIDDPPCNYNPDTYDEVNKIGTNWKLYKWNNVRGRDGDNYERVYIKTRTAVAPEIDCTVSEGVVTYPNWTYPDPNNPSQTITHTYQDAEYLPAVKGYNPELTGTNQPYSNDRFTDDPTGVSPEFPYEWMAERKKKLNTSTNMMEWRPFSLPALWAKYSFDGQHGNSVQVAYAIAGSTLTISDKTGNLPVSSEVTWYSNTTGLTPGNNQYLWMSQRVGFTGNWGLWEDPIRLSGQDGQPGADGSDIEFIYKRCNSISEVTKPGYGPNTQGKTYANDDFVPDGWTDNPQGVGIDSTSGEFYKYEMACQRTKDAGINKSWSDSGNDWVGPFIWSAYGDTGMDGDGVEYVYYRYQGSGVLRKPSGPMALTSTHLNDGIEWNGGIVNVGTASTPNWQPKDWDSSDGKGDFDAWDQDYGYFNEQGEWIPRVYDSLGTNLNPTHWSDDPKGVGYFDENNDGTNELYLYEYVSVRKRTNGVWGEFSDPRIWASWGTDIYIDNGVWIINGVPSGKAEGEDGKGIALKGSVDFLTRKELEDYKTENAGVIPQTELNKLRALQQIQPNDPYSLGITSVEVGDCYVVRKNRYLYTSKKRFDTDSNTADDWDTSPGQTAVNNLWWVSGDNPGVGQINWAEIGEFQGADGENNYLHIAWAPASSVKFEDPEDPGKITLVHPFICDYTELDQGINYEWMGICKSDDINDPVDNYNNPSLGWDSSNSNTWNWAKYSWNHVKGRDGSDYERVYIRTSKYDPNNPPLVTDAYSSDLSSAYQQPEFRPYVDNPSACGAEGSSTTPVTYRFTDDPKGVSTNFPYEWISERRKTLDDSTLKVLWGRFTAPALWSTYSFDGMTAGLSKETDIIIIDAVGNPVGGIGDSSNPRFYTEVKIYDPRLNNGVGGYLEYQSSGTIQEGKYKITSVVRTPNDSTNFTHNITPSSGKIYISKLGDSNEWRKTTNECKLDINVTIYGGRTFSFSYTLTLSHSPQTYLTYNLTNDLDIFTYRTRTSTYDGLPITTCLETWTSDGTSDKLNDNTVKNNGYIKSVKVVGISGGFLEYIKVGGDKVTSKTVEATSTVNDSTGVVTYNTVTATIYSDSACTIATGLYLDVKSDGTITLRKDGSSFIDLADTSHNLDISCIAVYGGVEYASPTKTFSLSEKNDATLYKLVPSDTSITKNEDGSYTPSSISVQVAVSDETGTSNKAPGTNGLIPGTSNIFVKYQNPSVNDNLLYPCPSFSNVSDFFRILIVQDPSGTTPIYHDRQTVQINKPGISQTYIDLSTDKFIINCDKDGKILGITDTNYSVLARLMWGDQECIIDTNDNNCSMTPTGFSWILNNPSSTSRVCNASVGWNNTYSPPRYAGSFSFHPNKILNSGTITIYMEGTFADGVTRHATETITVEASRQGIQGPEGDRGDFKSTAFIRTETDISNYTPVGGDYDDPIPEGFVDSNDQEVQGITETWQDGIPEGKKKLWASTCTFYGNDYPNGSSGWSSPREMLDTPEYDVEFAYQQSNGDPPADPVDGDNGNRHRDSDPYGYTGQVWFDPQKDKHKGNATTDRDFNNMYWRAERERVNEGTWSPWVITQIKGESEPSIQAVPDIFVIETDPTGKLSQDQDINFTTKLFSGNQIQTPTIGSGTKIEYVGFVSGTTSTTTYLSTNTTHASFNSTTKAITWTITVPGNQTLQDSSIKVTMKNSYCSDTTNIPVTIKRQTRSSFKSFVFKRFASTPSANDAPSTTATGGSYENNGLPTGTSGRDSGWSDGLPTSGTDPIYMSSRTFYSDNSQSTSWSTPVRMSDTDIFDVEFSLSIGKPNDPPDNVSQRNNAGWYDPNRSPARDDWDQMRWMATRTKTGNSWGNWAINKIKGETGDTGTGISSVTPWYKAFDTLDVVIPSAGNETDGWAEDGDLTGAGWTNSYVKPTKENPYLWKFIRTIYENPPSVVHNGLEMIQVWSENMINPNLLDDTDFEPEDIRDNGAVSGSNLNGAFSDSGGTMGAWRTWCVSNLRTYDTWGKNNGVSNDPPPLGGSYYGGIAAKGDTTETGYIVVLKQNIYDSSLGLYKVNPGSWYTLSFWIHGTSAYPDATFHLQILSRNSLGASVEGMEIVDTDAGVTVNGHVINGRTADFSYVTTKNSSVSINYNQYTNNWRKFVITFKIKDTIPDNLVTALLEWKLSVAKNIAKGAGVYINKPKLEIGKVATDYISGDAIKDPYPRMTKWKTRQQYYKGQFGEPYLDIVGYGNLWFRCRNTHISSDSNIPIIGRTTAYWEPASDFSFVATNLLLAETAVIDNLVATSLRTGERGVIPHVEMSGSRIEFYGTGMNPSIRFNVDASGTGILEFLDNDGNVLYNLGPNGITRLVDAMNSNYANSALYKITSNTYVGDLITVSGNAVNPSITGNSFNITNKYTLTEGYQKIGDITKYRISNDSSPSAFNGRMFDGDQPSDSTLSQYLANNNAEDYSTLFSDETNWYITLNYGPILSFSMVNGDDAVYTMKFHQYSKGRLSKTVTIYFSETEVRNATGNLRQLYGHRLINNVVNNNLKVLPLLNL